MLMCDNNIDSCCSLKSSVQFDDPRYQSVYDEFIKSCCLDLNGCKILNKIVETVEKLFYTYNTTCLINNAINY